MKVSKNLNKIFSSIDHPLMAKIMEEMNITNKKIDFISGDDSNISYVDDKILDFDHKVVAGIYTGTMVKLLKSGDTENLYLTLNGDQIKSEPTKISKIPDEQIEEIAWKTTDRVSMKVGRFFKKFTDDTILPSQLEELVNIYRGTYNSFFENDSRLEIVKGEDIIKWYHHKKYEGNYSLMSGIGSLNKSCTSHARNIELYRDNSNVSLIILKSEKLEDKISGRAILWKAIDGNYFMDRVYTTTDSDIQLFYKMAKENGWYTREHNSAGEARFKSPEGKLVDIKVEVQMEKWEYDGYPYMDTICFLDMKSGILTNIPPTPETIMNYRRIQLYGGRGGWVEMGENIKVEAKKDPHNPSHWN